MSTSSVYYILLELFEPVSEGVVDAAAASHVIAVLRGRDEATDLQQQKHHKQRFGHVIAVLGGRDEATDLQQKKAP